MHVVSGYPNGIFSWADLATTDQASAKRFYSSLFGWTATDVPISGDDVYSLMQIDGKRVAGIGPQPPEMQSQGMPAFWATYINHDNVDAVAEKISAAGGTLMMPPMDVMQEGRMMMAQDPTGAAFGVWQPMNHTGAQVVNSPNSLVWTELYTPNLNAAQQFYGDVFSWSYVSEMEGYVSAALNGRRHAGLMALTPEMAGTPPNWSVYFMVEDIKAATDKVKELGGNVLMPLRSAGEVGTFSVVQDPQGAVFFIIQLNGSPDTPPSA
jgi:predicted enzyme related to lactoylglutathione lyase